MELFAGYVPFMGRNGSQEDNGLDSAGDCLYKEPDAVHGCVCLEPGMLIDCFSPMRADFLEKK